MQNIIIIIIIVFQLVFQRQANERRIDFSTIATAAHIDINDVRREREEKINFILLQVELLVMRGLSLGLVKGTIDEVDKQVNMTWVQPRVLDYSQVYWNTCILFYYCNRCLVLRKESVSGCHRSS